MIALCLQLKNAGLEDQGCVEHLSEAVAGAWRGAGHSNLYEDPLGYAYMIKYLLCTDDPKLDGINLEVGPFTANETRNDYELPWILRGVMDDPEVIGLYSEETRKLKNDILEWQPTTKALLQIKKRVGAYLLGRSDGHLTAADSSINGLQLEPMAGKTALRQFAARKKLLSSPSSLSLSTNKDEGIPQDTPDQTWYGTFPISVVDSRDTNRIMIRDSSQKRPQPLGSYLIQKTHLLRPE